MRSMTGFGRAEVQTSLGRLILELQSVNRKYLETLVFLPKDLTTFEVDVKKILSKEIFRGQVIARFTLLADGKSSMGVLPDVSFLKRLKTGWRKIAQELHFDPKEIDLYFLANQAKLTSIPLEIKDMKKLEKPIFDCTKKALKELQKMKGEEAKTLLKDILMRMQNIEGSLKRIEKDAPEALNRYRKRLLEKIEGLVQNPIENQERIDREVVIFADKLDITEEIIRFRSHLTQFRSLLKIKTQSVGKKMDFLGQEMMRETNTIAAKSQDSSVSKEVVEIKSELERIREQVQNIE